MPLLLSAPRAAPAVILIAERFSSPVANLSTVTLPLDVIATTDARAMVIVLIRQSAVGPDWRIVLLPLPRVSGDEALELLFDPFDSDAGVMFTLGVLTNDCSGHDMDTIVTLAANREPIVLRCGAINGFPPERVADGRTIVALHKRGARSAHGIDVYWRDASGIYLRGWVHAYEHRLRRLTLQSGGRSVSTARFSDRSDLLAFYPEYEHVRHSGFALYLTCPAGTDVQLLLETAAGETTVRLEFPDGAIPRWPEDEPLDDLSPLLRRFCDFIDPTHRVLQIGARTPRGVDLIPPRTAFRGRVFGLDIHPGNNVDLVGDAHRLASFVRPASLDGVYSSSVLEHLEAPWILAAEINRVLKPGGLVYQQVPGTWPAHAQPNDFWRMSAEGLRVLFGPATGFEVLETAEAGAAAVIPSPQWREGFLDMPSTPAWAMSEILARKVSECRGLADRFRSKRVACAQLSRRRSATDTA
jgi:SAM-dependent methyltransferase